MKFLLKLYPAAWRERYGDEVEALMSDARFGWREGFDLFWGAMRMRMRLGSEVGIVAMFRIAGMLAGLGVWYFKTPALRAMAAVQITQTGAADNNAVVLDLCRRGQAALTSRKALAELIQDPRLNLYAAERRVMPLEGLVDEMRRDVQVRILSEDRHGPSRTVQIQFAYSDADKALEATNKMTGQLVQAATVMQSRTGTTYFETAQRPVLLRRYFSRRVQSYVVSAGSILGLLWGLWGYVFFGYFRRRSCGRFEVPPGQVSRRVSTRHAGVRALPGVGYWPVGSPDWGSRGETMPPAAASSSAVSSSDSSFGCTWSSFVSIIVFPSPHLYALSGGESVNSCDNSTCAGFGRPGCWPVIWCRMPSLRDMNRAL